MKHNRIIYTDASLDDKNHIAGIGVIIKEGYKEKPYSFWVPARTINEAELFAIYTDSQTAISYIKGDIKEKPRTRQQYINHKHCELLAYKLRKRGVIPQKIKKPMNINTKFTL